MADAFHKGNSRKGLGYVCINYSFINQAVQWVFWRLYEEIEKCKVMNFY